MLKKRIIPCLDIMNGRTVKGINFQQLKDAGNPVELAQKYTAAGADELVFLDINATIENRDTWVTLVKEIAATINIPFTVGGGINTVQNARRLVKAGADKLTVNSAAVKFPLLISQMASELGSQCVVLAIDTKWVNGEWMVFVQGGRTPTKYRTLEWAQEAERLGAGEILLTSMNNDGVKTGFALDITKKIAENVNIPVIASGGAGALDHFKQVFEKTGAAAALAASIFHYGEITIPELKQYLHTQNIPVRL
jgi:imidazole glycerol-phosphate synthase subunit HisF